MCEVAAVLPTVPLRQQRQELFCRLRARFRTAVPRSLRLIDALCKEEAPETVLR